MAGYNKTNNLYIPKIVPKTHKSRLALDKRSPKVHENIKKAIFLRGLKSSSFVNNVLHELNYLKKPNSIILSKKNDIHPFESHNTIEFLCQKNDCSLFAFGCHSKKRPNNLVIGRCFDFQILDIVELGVDPHTFRPYQNFMSIENNQYHSISNNACPLIFFFGEEFETNDTAILCKNLLLDFFRGHEQTHLYLSSIEHIITFSFIENILYLRHFALLLSRQSETSNTPLIKIHEIGPQINFSVRRVFSADKSLKDLSMKTNAPSKWYGSNEKKSTKKIKNRKRGQLGQTIGMLYPPKQEISKLTTKHGKALKRQSRQSATQRNNKKYKTY